MLYHLRLLRLFVLIAVLCMCQANGSDQIPLTLRTAMLAPDGGGGFVSVHRQESWPTEQTAMIVCDVWDYHHSRNAVERLEAFAPRLNAVLTEARRRGVTIIHAPSDCMDFYQDHPARLRAREAPQASHVPYAIDAWCSAIAREQSGVFPIDQADGGEDDDPRQLAAWREKLAAMGRNPQLPWQAQSPQITIDDDQDFISDSGSEIWNILSERKIRNVVLTGVHVNMCVLGRPFGLRQMSRNGMHVVLMRDMTDSMYNPASWPYVDHHEGTRRVIEHIERYVCPTISSDQWIGGEEFRLSGTKATDVSGAARQLPPTQRNRHWQLTALPLDSADALAGEGTLWLRCTAWIPQHWLSNQLSLQIPGGRRSDPVQQRIWINGQPASAVSGTSDGLTEYRLPSAAIAPDDVNLIVIAMPPRSIHEAFTLRGGDAELTLAGRWQYCLDTEDADWSELPLPAKFGIGSDVLFAPEDPLWVPRAVTQVGQFTPGIEGPAVDAQGNIFAVNFARQGTVGRVRPDGMAEVFVDLPEGSVGNGIRFADNGDFFVADYTRHNVLRVHPQTREIVVHAHQPLMNQPNDLALAPDRKTLFASDPNWAEGTGQLWRIDADGSMQRLASGMGTTNGIDVSPDGKTLYVNESVQRNVWAFTITSEGDLTDKRLVKQFPDHGFDGMRCDIDGNLYITRYGKGTVVKMTPEGTILREIPVLGDKPSNLCFGGPDRRTIYVTEVDGLRIVSFRADRPGRE